MLSPWLGQRFAPRARIPPGPGGSGTRLGRGETRSARGSVGHRGALVSSPLVGPAFVTVGKGGPRSRELLASYSRGCTIEGLMDFNRVLLLPGVDRDEIIEYMKKHDLEGLLDRFE